MNPAEREWQREGEREVRGGEKGEREREGGRRTRDRVVAPQGTGGRGKAGATHAVTPACCTMQHPLTDWKVGWD